MTDRVNALTVVLEHDTRTDDVLALVNAIRHMRGVVDVGHNVVDSGSYIALQRARSELRDRLWKALEAE